MNDTSLTMLGAAFQSAPGVLVLGASRLKSFRDCKQRYHLEHLLGLRPDSSLESDSDLASGYGLQAHGELFQRHENPGTHDHDVVLEAGAYDDKVLAAVRRHGELCPGQDGATYLGGEVTLRWFYSMKLVLVTGRIDAVWRYDDGTIAIHDYKTGPVQHDIEHDEGTLIYALLAAANYPGQRIRVVYEYLGGEHPVAVPVDITREHLRKAYQLVIDTAEAIRREQSFPPNPHPTHCGSCPYRNTCPVVHPSVAR